MQQLSTKHVRRWQLHRRRVGLGMSTKGGTSRFRWRKKTISISLCVMWSATRYGRPWSSKPRRGDGPAFGDDPPARRSKSNCSVFGRWHIRRAGASSSTNRKRRRRWRRFVVAWPVASPTEARIGSTGRPNNSDRNRLFEHRTGQERYRHPMIPQIGAPVPLSLSFPCPFLVKQHSNRCRWRDDRYPGMRAGFAWPDGDKKASQRRSGQSLFGSVPPRATRR